MTADGLSYAKLPQWFTTRLVRLLQVGHSCRRRPVSAPRNELLYRCGASFGEDLDAAVGPVLDPAGEAEPLRLALRRRSEIDALNAPADEQLNLLEPHRQRNP